MIEVKGKCGISAKIICDSISEVGVRLTTMEIEYPRLILSELNTHRMLSKNSASSRAIPFEKMQKQLTARPVRFGAAQKGMQDCGEDFEAPVFVHRYMVEAFTHWLSSYVPEEEHNTIWSEESYGYFTSAHNWWRFSGWLASGCAQMFYEAGYHKQVYNRRTETDQMMKTVISGTEWANFFFLRNDSAADPTIAELARCMQEAREKSVPQLLKVGEYHLPYVQTRFYAEDDYKQSYEILIGEALWQGMALENAIKVSCARCCAVSFRNTDYTLEKSLEVYERLISESKIHGSALEHCCTPMQPRIYLFGGNNANTTKWINDAEKSYTWQRGVSHADRDGNLWSGNMKSWIQHRKLIDGENYTSSNM